MADRFWVGDLGNWSDALNHWSASTGGAPNASKPTSADNVYFDANSFSTGSQTVTVDETANCLDMDWTGATNTPTLAGGGTLNIFGDFTAISAMGKTKSGVISMVSSVASTLKSAGTWATVDFYQQGSGTVTLLDSLTCLNVVRTIGTLVLGGYDITTSLDFYETGAGAKTLTPGASTISCRDWLYNGTNLTLTPSTSTIIVTRNFTSTAGITTYNNVEINGATCTITGSNTFATLTFKADTTQTITFTDGTTQTITTPVFTGSSGKVKTLIGSSTGGWTITKAGGGTVDADYLALSYSEATPGQTWYTANSTDTVGNSGWIFAWIAGNILGVTVATINKINGVTLATVNKLNGVSN